MTNAAGPIAYVVKRYPRLSETFILNEIRAMERLGYRLHIFTLLPPEPPPHHPGVQEVRAPLHHPPQGVLRGLAAQAAAHWRALRANPAGYRKAARQAWRLAWQSRAPFSAARQFLRAGYFAGIARRAGVTHVHAHFAHAPTEVAGFISHMTDLPFSFTAHAKDLYLTAPKLVSARVEAATFVTTCTCYNADFLRSLVPEASRHKISLVYHGIDLSLFQFRPPSYAFLETGAPPLIISVGRLVPKKGLDDLIAACAGLRERGQDFRCEIIGAGPLRQNLLADIKRFGLERQVSLRGAMTHAELIGRYAEADLFVLPPRITEDGDRDGIPNVIVEAMAIGLPVVSTDVSGIPEMVVHGQTGLLVPPRDPAALASAIATLLAQAALGQRLAGRAREKLVGDFDCWQTTRQIGGLIESKFACLPGASPNARLAHERPAKEYAA
jgi:glycosyltransferase involved in cell wall biosynthesis